MLLRLGMIVAFLAPGVAAGAEPNVAERWAVLVGVDDYANANDLRFCGADQSALRTRLIAAGFRPENVILLHDQASDNKYKPSQRNIEQQLRLVINSAEADDLLVVGFSGHGVSLDGKSYLCPSDATLGDPATLISLDGVYEQLQHCAARFKWVLVDACRNDPTLGGGRSFSASDGTKELALSLQQIKLPEGVVLLNSCAPGEISWEEEEFGHGVYMNYILEAMAGAGDADGDGAVSLNELQRYASGRTKAHVVGKFNRTQRPFSRSEGEAEALDFALLPVKLPTATASSPSPVAVVAPAAVAPAAVVAPAAATPEKAASSDVLTNSVGMQLTLISAGEFMMGATEAEAGTADMELPRHRVRITKPFFIGVHEVTQGQWQAVMNTTPWKDQRNVKEGANVAATYVSWEDAIEFCRRLSADEGKQYGLPTEAQWEYACRAGTTTEHSFTDGSLYDYAWWDLGPRLFSLPPLDADANKVTEAFAHPVGEKRPNPWGLYDVHGNVREWCHDGYDRDYYKQSVVDDPPGLGWGKFHPVRGGSWSSGVFACRSAYRLGEFESTRDAYTGFRVVRVP